jgi:uncharacterized protein
MSAADFVFSLSIKFSTVQLLSIATSFVIAGFVKGTTGFGFASVTTSLLVLATGSIPAAVALATIPAIISNLLVMRDANGIREAVRTYWKLYLSLFPGIALGTAALAATDGKTAAAVLGAMLVAYSCYAIARPKTVLSASSVNRLAAPTGFFTGFFHGLSGSQMLPLMPYFLSQRLDTPIYLQATNISFTLSSSAVFAGLAYHGLIDWPLTIAGAFCLVPTYAGVEAGTLVRNRLSVATFKLMVQCALILLGGGLLVKSFV